MTATARQTFWGFVFWVKHNPYKSINDMTELDFDEMVKQFAAVNATEGTLSTDPLNYGTIDFPKKGTTTRYAADGSGVASGTTLATNIAACAQSLYPEQHLGS